MKSPNARAVSGYQSSGRPASIVRCGTNTGWSYHIKADEKPCDACATAKREYDQRRNSPGKTQIKNRQYAKAQSRALQRLKAAHPDEYQALYTAAKAEVLAQDAAIPTDPASRANRPSGPP